MKFSSYTYSSHVIKEGNKFWTKEQQHTRTCTHTQTYTANAYKATKHISDEPIGYNTTTSTDEVE